MDITRAFPLDSPRIDITWGLTEHGFLELLKGWGPKKITNGHYEMRCRFFGLPESLVHFHFEPRTDGRLCEIEFFRKPQRQRVKGFEQLQQALEKYLGPPAQRDRTRSVAVESAYWRHGKVSVAHEYYYQSGQYEKILFKLGKA